ncbi:DUF5025 domain-containing protein [Flavobacteriaceae bacterium GSB9]|nr:DUF5025 domain-containing protein [Flavobacteriaceae bacterium GSB9]
MMTLTSCSINRESEPTTNSIDSTDYLYYISGKIDGEPFIFGQKLDDSSLKYSNIIGGSLSGICAYGDSYGINYEVGVYPGFSENLASINFEFIRLYLCGQTPTQAEQFNSLFPVKSYTIASSNDNLNGTTGAVGATYSPNVGEDTYYTSYGGDQTNSYFEITSSVEMNQYLLEVLVNVAQEIEGNFAITLYNYDDPSDVITITDGKFKLQPALP